MRSSKPSRRPARLQHVAWYEDKGIWSHQYIILKFQGPKSKSRYYRVERDKTGWFNIWPGNLDKRIITDQIPSPLTQHSYCLADYEVIAESAGSHSTFTPVHLGQLIDHINKDSPYYSLTAFNCWWFAGCVFSSVARRVHDLGSVRLEAHCSVATPARRTAPMEEVIDLCGTYYIFSRRPYWINLGYVPLVLISMVSTLTDALFFGFIALSLAVEMSSVFKLVYLRITRGAMPQKGAPTSRLRFLAGWSISLTVLVVFIAIGKSFVLAVFTL